MMSGSQVDAYDPVGANGVTDPSIFAGRILLFKDLKEGCRWSVKRHAGSSIDYIRFADYLKHRRSIFPINQRVTD